MKISDEIALSARNLARRKGRTALTLIGVVIGTCMVVLMISLGIAQTQANDEMLQSWGDLTQVQVYGYGTLVDANGKTIHLDDAAIESIKKLDHVVAATAYAEAYNLNGTIDAGKNGRYQTQLYNVVGIDPAALEPMGFALQSGKWLPEGGGNSKATKIPILVGANAGYGFEDTRKSQNSSKRYRWQGMTDAKGNPLPPFVDIDKDKMTLTLSYGEGSSQKSQTWDLEIVGVLQQDYAKGYFTDSGFVMRVADLKMLETIYNKMARITTNEQNYQQVYVKVDDLKNVPDVEEAIHELGYSNTYSMSQQREEMNKQTMRSQMIFGGVAAVSLLVAAINIINTMTMAIYERTREIGVMKVLGCELKNIRTMFLLESSCIGFLGGVLGVAFSLLASLVLNNISTILGVLGQDGNIDISGIMGGGMYYGASSTTISVIPPWLVLGALVFATVVGFVAGIVPANKAVKISALEAIRHD